MNSGELLKILRKIIINSWLEVFNIKNADEFSMAYNNLSKLIQNSIEYKTTSEPVTLFDKKINNSLINKIKKSLPSFNIISEEKNNRKIGKNLQTIMIDPIDGTTNFVNGVKHFCTAIAVKDEKNKAYLGAVYDPIKNEFFYSIGKKEAFCNDIKISTSGKSLKDGLLLVSDGSSDKSGNRKIIEKVKALGISYKILGSANLDLCQVARGKAVGYIKTKAPEWDYLAGKFILENAGGKCEVIGSNVIASNGMASVHKMITSIIQ